LHVDVIEGTILVATRLPWSRIIWFSRKASIPIAKVKILRGGECWL
jgi:hypothetical protein